MSYIAISCLSENKIIDRSSPVLIVNLDSTKVSEFRYSDIFKSVTAIELDEKDALLGGIDKMQIYKSQLFVLDSRSTKGVYIFDRKGTFMRKIGNIGLAPDEYVSCDDFTINIDDNELPEYYTTFYIVTTPDKRHTHYSVPTIHLHCRSQT